MTASTATASLTREAILEAAIRLFQQHGFSGVGMRQIADHLKIKAPSLYHHFASKDALAQKALEQYREVQRVRLEAIEQKPSLLEKLQAYVDLFTDTLSDGARACMFLVMVREPNAPEAACANELKLFAKQNVDWLEAVLRASGKRVKPGLGVSERQLAEMIFASLEGMMAMALVEDDPAKIFRSMAGNYLTVTLNSVMD